MKSGRVGEVDHSAPSYVEIKNGWSCVNAPTTCLRSEDKNNFTSLSKPSSSATHWHFLVDRCKPHTWVPQRKKGKRIKINKIRDQSLHIRYFHNYILLTTETKCRATSTGRVLWATWVSAVSPNFHFQRFAFWSSMLYQLGATSYERQFLLTHTVVTCTPSKSSVYMILVTSHILTRFNCSAWSTPSWSITLGQSVTSEVLKDSFATYFLTTAN